MKPVPRPIVPVPAVDTAAAAVATGTKPNLTHDKAHRGRKTPVFFFARSFSRGLRFVDFGGDAGSAVCPSYFFSVFFPPPLATSSNGRVARRRKRIEKQVSTGLLPSPQAPDSA